MNILGAISTFSTNPEAAGQSLQPCIDEATNQIADYNYKKTPVYLGATAGMRLLKYGLVSNFIRHFMAGRTCT